MIIILKKKQQQSMTFYISNMVTKNKLKWFIDHRLFIFIKYVLSISFYQSSVHSLYWQLVFLFGIFPVWIKMSYKYSNLKELPWSHDHELPSSHDHELLQPRDHKLHSSRDHCSFLLSYPAITTRVFSLTFTPVNQYVPIAPFP